MYSPIASQTSDELTRSLMPGNLTKFNKTKLFNYFMGPLGKDNEYFHDQQTGQSILFGGRCGFINFNFLNYLCTPQFKSHDS